jgi:hypothetical protein
MSVVENMPKSERGRSRHPSSSRYSNHGTSWEEKKESEYTKFEKTSVVKFEDVMNANQSLGVGDLQDSKFAQERRPSTPSPRDIADGKYKASARKSKSKPAPIDDTFETDSAEPVTIEVKPLPKIRLSLMPSPREEDEEDLDDEEEPKSKQKASSSKSNSSKSSQRSWSKSRRSSKSRSSSKAAV